MKDNFAGSFRLQIVDSAGKLMHEDDHITIWTEWYPPVVGDELTLGYDILRQGQIPDSKQITLKVLRRKLWFPAPDYRGFKVLKGAGVQAFHHDRAWSLGVWEGGSVTTLVCTPTAKNGGLSGVKRLLKHRQAQKKMIAADK